MAGWRFWRRSRRLQAPALTPEDYWRLIKRANVRPGMFLRTGTLRDGGSLKPSASTGTKEHGTRTRATVTTVECSSYYLPGTQPVDSLGRILLLPANSYSVPGVFTRGTEVRGVSGEQLGSAG